MSLGRDNPAPRTKAEQEALDFGREKWAEGRTIERPNLLHLQEVAQLSDSDRANAGALANTNASQISNSMVNSTLNGGLRQTGLGSGAFRLALQDAANTGGAGKGTAVNNTDQNMDTMDLQSRVALMDMALKGQDTSLKGFRTGVAGVAEADVRRVMNRNLKRQRDMQTLSSVVGAAASMAPGLATHHGTFIDAEGNIGFRGNFAGRLAESGFRDEDYMSRLLWQGRQDVDPYSRSYLGNLFGPRRYEPVEGVGISDFGQLN